MHTTVFIGLNIHISVLIGLIFINIHIAVLIGVKWSLNIHIAVSIGLNGGRPRPRLSISRSWWVSLRLGLGSLIVKLLF